MTKHSFLPNEVLRSTSSSLSLRFRQIFRKRIKHTLKYLIPCTRCHPIGTIFFAIIVVYFMIVHPSPLIYGRFSSFDDIEDMRLIAEKEAEFLRRKQNESSVGSINLLHQYNATDIVESRKIFDYIYGEITRKPNPPLLTKYKVRLLRELFARAHYKSVSKFFAAVDVSCNYVNDVNDEDSMYRFKCAETSHRCPDGRFLPQNAFEPAEDTSVTWKDIVIVLLVSTSREPYLKAAAETWISRLHPEATLFFAMDGEGPTLPDSIVDRPNTFIYSYSGLTGLQYLDIKAFETWSKVYDKFVLSGKRYFLKIDDDSLLLGHNLIRFLNKVEHWFSSREQALYFGHPFCGHGDSAALGYETWCYAGGGAYGLNTEALRIMLAQIKGGCAYFYDYVTTSNGRPADDRYGGRYEDIMIGRCLRQARTRTQVSGTSLLACGSFFPYAPLYYYQKFGRSKEAMCMKLDGDPITIHNLEPSAIRYLDHIVFEYPLAEGVVPFSPNNERIDELIRLCQLNGKKMYCNLSLVPSF